MPRHNVAAPVISMARIVTLIT
ncbi:hypothetical protein CORC01_12603 [Colletotrichum orchidophilum]|uniref:Uncharacterized protein n=1 Tax=Colletotrichum orchidophilum TaxID=1209926 RepID=A0A1G4ASE7_9PEZI|nr:hypothetical protein CORC01_12603 [Colletotrichum orchidophilum]